MPEASPSIGEMWPLMSRVECHSEFESPPQEDLLQFEVLFLRTFFLQVEEKNIARRSVRGARWMWCAPQAVLVHILFHSLCDV
jgi:hypothetical protein